MQTLVEVLEGLVARGPDMPPKYLKELPESGDAVIALTPPHYGEIHTLTLADGRKQEVRGFAYECRIPNCARSLNGRSGDAEWTMSLLRANRTLSNELITVDLARSTPGVVYGTLVYGQKVVILYKVG